MIIFLRLTAHSDKNAALRETASFIRDGTQSEEIFEIHPETFRLIPGLVFAYWANKKIIKLFSILPSLQGSLAQVSSMLIRLTHTRTSCSMRARKDGPCSTPTISHSPARFPSSRSSFPMTSPAPHTSKPSAGRIALSARAAARLVSRFGSRPDHMCRSAETVGKRLA